jgi:hypothetical protein
MRYLLSFFHRWILQVRRVAAIGFKNIKKFSQFFIYHKFVMWLMQKYIQLTMLIGYFLQIVLRNSNIFLKIRVLPVYFSIILKNN